MEMMSLVLLGLAVVASGPIAFVLVLVLLRRAGDGERRLAAIERELRDLQRLVASITTSTEAHAPSVAPEGVRPVPPAPPVEAPVPRAAGLPAAEAPRVETPPPVEALPVRPPEPHAPPRVPPPAPSARPALDWERLLGVRGAAILGGIFLAFAGLFFFQYAVEHDWFPPWLRVIAGTLTGLAAISASERLRRDYPGTVNPLAGGGVAVLYAAFWAAGIRYHLVPLPFAFFLMAAVTAACCALSSRYRSQLIALLGLAGGFLTPYLLSTGVDRPIGLFGYVLLLDLGLLSLARARRWPLLAALSLAGTVVYQFLWVFFRMGPDRVGLGLGILAVFALLFAAAGRLAPEENRREWILTQAAGVLVPFVLALYFAGNARLHVPLPEVGALLALLAAGAGWLARVQGDDERLGIGAAAGSVAVLLAWAAVRPIDAAATWQLCAVSVVLALVFHVFVEWQPERADVAGPAPAALIASGGFFVLLVGAMATSTSATPWPWVGAWVGLAALTLRHAGFPRRALLHAAAAVGVGVALAWLRIAQDVRGGSPPLVVYEAIMLLAALGFQVVALVRRASPARVLAEQGGAAVAAVLLVGLLYPPFVAGPPLGLLCTGLALGVLVALSGTRAPSGAWLVAAVGLTALVHSAWVVRWLGTQSETRLVLGVLALQLGAALFFTAWPFLAAARLRDEPLAWAASALAGPAWFLSLKRLWTLGFGDGAIGALPLILGAAALAATMQARSLWPPAARMRTRAVAWFSTVAMGFVTVAIPLQLDKEWITIGWALEGLAVTVLWTRLDYAGLKYFGVALLAAATVRLVANPAVLGYYPRPAWRIVNWLLYTYLVPAAALLGTASLLGPHEMARATAWERERIYLHGRPIGAVFCGLAGLVVVFVWINLAIADWFATGATLRVSFERLPARDLTTSIAWALYALALLAVGVTRRSTGLRWASLGILLVTIAKVFLYDVGELHDLYRVASLLGLALSLLLVSLAYQRFVFRSTRTEEA